MFLQDLSLFWHNLTCEVTFFCSIWKLQVTIRVSSVFAMSRSDYDEIMATVNERIRVAQRKEQNLRVTALKNLRDSIDMRRGEENARSELGKILAQDKMRVEVNAEKQEMTVYLVFEDDDITKVCLNKDSNFLALTTIIADLTGSDRNSMIIEHNGCLIDSFELVFDHGIVDGDFLKVVFHHMAEYQYVLDDFVRNRHTPFVGLNVADATRPHPCQITMKTVRGNMTFVYHYADGQTVGDVETALACYFENYLWGNVNFKDCYALRLPKSFLASWEALRPFGDEFGQVNFLLACRLSGGGKRAKNSADAITAKDVKFRIDSAMAQLEQQCNVPSITETVVQAKAILDIVNANPKKGASALLKQVPRAKLSNIITDTTSSSRVNARVQFLAEHVLADDFQKLDTIKFQGEVAQGLLVNVILYAILLEYADANNTISWSSLTKTATDIMTENIAETSVVSEGSNCAAM